MGALVEALVDLGYQLSAVLTPREVAMMVLDTADQLFSWDAAAVDLCRGETQSYSLVTMDTLNGKRCEVEAEYHEIKKHSMFARVLKNGPQLILRESTKSDRDRILRAFGERRNLSASLMFVPIRRGGENTGLITIQSYTPYQYNETDLKWLQVLANFCSAAMARTFAEQYARETEERLKKMLMDAKARRDQRKKEKD